MNPLPIIKSNPDTRPKLTCGKSRTIQKPTDAVDINEIVKRAHKTGHLVDPSINPTRQPMYGDFSTGADFQEAQNCIASATSDFMELPAYIREKFNNDPSVLIDAMSDPEHKEALQELGLLPPEPVAAAAAEPVVEPVVEDSSESGGQPVTE